MGRLKIENKLSNKKSNAVLLDKSKNQIEKLSADDEKRNEHVKPKSVLDKVQFKTIKKSKKDLKLSLAKSKAKSKIETLKNDVLQQIKMTDANQALDYKNFIDKTQNLRVTNSFLKRIIKSKKSKNENDDTVKLFTSDLSDKNFGMKIKKKEKKKLKKQIFLKKVNLLKSHIKDAKDKAKREKTVITGDMKPMIDSLFDLAKPTSSLDLIKSNKNKANKNNVTFSTDFSDKIKQQMQRKEVHNQNLERENSKSIPKESVRTKKQKDDLSLFNELVSYSAFAENPLELIKNTLK